MVTEEQAFSFTQSLLADMPETEEKMELLKKHTKDRLYWALLRCFLVGLDYGVVSEFVEKEHPDNQEAVGEWMLEQLEERLRDKDELYNAIEDLKKEVETSRHFRDEYDQGLKEIHKLKMENKNILHAIDQKDRFIKQLQDKLKENVPTVGTKSKEDEPPQPKKTITNLSLETFKQEVLMKKEFSAEQKDYLFSLLEEGEDYSAIRTLAVPSMGVDDMKRFYQLSHNKKGGERKKKISIVKEKLFNRVKEEK